MTKRFASKKPARTSKPRPAKARQPKPPKPLKPAKERRPLLEGEWLLAALVYVLRVCPKDARVEWAKDAQGGRLLSSHNDVLSLTVFVPQDVRCDLVGSVTRASIRELVALMRGIRPTKASIDERGQVELRYGAQPTVTFKMAVGAPGVGWAPPRPGDLTEHPLRLESMSLKAVYSWPGCTIRETHHRDCTARMDVHGGDGTLVARAVLVEEGGRLFPVNPTQGEIRGTESVATKASAGAGA